MTIFISVLVWFLMMAVCAYIMIKHECDEWTIFLTVPFIIFIAISITDGLASLYAFKTANFYKKHYNIEYTPHEVFWNGEQIKNQIIGEKKRLEIEVK